MPTKPSSPDAAPKRREAIHTRNAVLINQLATPGLGSHLAKRYIAGTGQLLLAISGFVCVMVWFGQISLRMWRLIQDLPARPDRWPHAGWVGLAFFVAAWVWAGITSLSLLREARRAGQGNPPPIS